ncbi:hypothetical protein DPEC_G00301900 [Dallia pectoralis]|uniref:Uncharacterized protein n=1 Tax=Dallia pectoralis TaxID=75939 RepID=A0ACC2FGU8_DALPE|nr:hypothetical protein DPEC_G00301900 [Dallia pectoralis]
MLFKRLKFGRKSCLFGVCSNHWLSSEALCQCTLPGGVGGGYRGAGGGRTVCHHRGIPGASREASEPTPGCIKFCCDTTAGMRKGVGG